ncbi:MULTISPECIES: 30S ribosomal protein S16 [Robiginitalea]|uniref:30S ribosomal protein S16 n=1 Tax=Robiginitalea TaxID=252306 RepID=UPI0002D741FA|nr:MULTISPECIES: 30S ribosomal protein S16 [Robiginitalea]MDC6354316.1 30S ribosomal protein S16 [Robiginitalea sp. PM2]MDC6375002.1 30S ribosomal protein S16 [Robiginitalea sp. SP8]
MPVRIRLQRHGKKGKPFYWIVAADVRAKRDGRFLEKLGIYNPNTNPATIEIDVDQSVQWLNDGAQPSETARRILSYKGVLLKHHLMGGVRKGALTEEEAEKKFQAWLDEKEQKVSQKTEGLEKAREEARAKALEAEREANEKRKAAAAEAEAPEAEETPETPEGESAAEEVEAVAAAGEPENEVAEAEAPAAADDAAQEEAGEEKAEAAPAEKAEEAKAEEKAEEAPKAAAGDSEEKEEKKEAAAGDKE